MTRPPLLSVSVMCTVAPARALSPFHAILLQALELFPAGSRPPLAELTERLQVVEPAFLAQAWTDLVTHRATDHDDFAAAQVSVSGDAARRRGWFLSGRVAEQTVVLLFDAAAGTPWPRVGFRLLASEPLRERPTWADTLSRETVEQALLLQAPKPGLAPGERLFGFNVDWTRARIG